MIFPFRVKSIIIITMIIIIIISYTAPGRGQKCTHPHTCPVHNRDHTKCLQSEKFQTLLSLHCYLPSPPNCCHQIELFETRILVYSNFSFAELPHLQIYCPQQGTLRVYGLRARARDTKLDLQLHPKNAKIKNRNWD